MTLDQIVAFVKANFDSFPMWFTVAFWPLVALILLISLLTLLFKAAGNTDFKDPVLAIFKFAGTLLKSFLAGSFKAIESPIERPKTKLVVKALAIVHSYLMCLFFFAAFIAVFFAMVVADPAKTWWLQLGRIGILSVMLYLAAFFRAESDRDWLAFKKQLAVVGRT